MSMLRRAIVAAVALSLLTCTANDTAAELPPPPAWQTCPVQDLASPGRLVVAAVLTTGAIGGAYLAAGNPILTFGTGGTLAPVVDKWWNEIIAGARVSPDRVAYVKNVINSPEWQYGVPESAKRRLLETLQEIPSVTDTFIPHGAEGWEHLGPMCAVVTAKLLTTPA